MKLKNVWNLPVLNNSWQLYQLMFFKFFWIWLARFFLIHFCNQKWITHDFYLDHSWKFSFFLNWPLEFPQAFSSVLLEIPCPQCQITKVINKLLRGNWNLPLSSFWPKLAQKLALIFFKCGTYLVWNFYLVFLRTSYILPLNVFYLQIMKKVY